MSITDLESPSIEGREIDGRYVVESIIGRGAMGVVCAARHKFTGARVAVKLARRELGFDREIESRFLVEARVPTAIDHPGVVKVLDAGKTTEGELFLVMELLTGTPLRDQMTVGMPPMLVRRIALELLDALAATHARNVIHRDLKPENVFLVAPYGTVKILDFGLTKMLADASARSMTVAGLVLGTITYMPPEQLMDAAAVDARGDLWSVGIILYEMLAGRRPHRANTIEAMFYALSHLEPDPLSVAVPGALPEFDAFFQRALARDPAGRFQTALDMAAAFAELPVGSYPGIPGRSSAPPSALGSVAQAPPERSSRRSPLPGVAALGHAQTAAISSHPPYGAPPSSPPIRNTPTVASMPARPSPYPPSPSAPAFAPGPPGPLPYGDAHRPSQSYAHIAPASSGYAAPRPRWPVFAGLGAIAFLLAVIALLLSRSRSDSPAVAEHPPARGSAAPPRTAALAPPVAVAEPEPEPEPEREEPTIEPVSPTQTPHRPKRGRTARAPRTAVAPATPAPAEPAPAEPAPATRAPIAPAPSELAEPADDCAIGCKLLDTCHLGTSTCRADCARSTTVAGCLRQAANDCNRFAACYFAWSCGGRTTSGTHSCAEALTCESTCGSSRGCLCTCVNGAAMTSAAALLAYNGCVLGCRGDARCIATRCAGHAQRCRAGG